MSWNRNVKAVYLSCDESVPEFTNLIVVDNLDDDKNFRDGSINSSEPLGMFHDGMWSHILFLTFRALIKEQRNVLFFLPFPLRWAN